MRRAALARLLAFMALDKATARKGAVISWRSHAVIPGKSIHRKFIADFVESQTRLLSRIAVEEKELPGSNKEDENLKRGIKILVEARANDVVMIEARMTTQAAHLMSQKMDNVVCHICFEESC